MDSSLRFSELDTSIPAKAFSPSFSSYYTKSQYSDIGYNNFQLSAIHKKTSKIKQYETTIYRFETKLQEEKRKANLSIKDSLGKLDDEQSQIENQYFELQEAEKHIRLEKIKSDKLFSEQKLRLLELEDESKRLAQSNEWANSTFSFKKSSTSMTDSVLQMKSQLSQVKMQIRDIRSKIFHYQKELLRVSEAISPVRSQQYILQSRIDEAKSDANETSTKDSSTKSELQKSLKMSVNEQLLSLTKYKTQKKISQLRNQIQELQSAKTTIMNKLLSLRSTVNDSLIQSIREQANQYKEAITKQKKLQNERIYSSRTAISRQLDIEVELDSIRKMKDDIFKQREEIDKVLKTRQDQITDLDKTLMLNDEIVTTGSEAILDELIRKIQAARLEWYRIPSSNSFVSSNTEIDSLAIDQNTYDEEQEIIKQRISDISLEIKEDSKEIEKLKKLLEIENEKQEQLSNAINAIKSRKVIIQTPKILLLNDRISYLQNKIEKRKNKAEKKANNINDLNSSVQQLTNELDLNTHYSFLKSEMFERFLRSMNWLYTQTQNNLKTWRIMRSITLPALNDWETKTLLAAINEVEDLNVRNSILCK